MPDDSDRESEEQEQEGVKILPGEWLRRLAVRRTRAQRRDPDAEAPPAPREAPEPPAAVPPTAVPPAAPMLTSEQPAAATGGSSSEPEPADAIAASAERARRQMREALAKVRSGVDEAAAEEHAREEQESAASRDQLKREEQESAASRDQLEESLRSSTGQQIETLRSQIEARLAQFEAHARAEVLAEAQAARTSLAEDAGRLTQQLRAAEEWLSQQRQSLIAGTPTGAIGAMEVEGANITVAQAMAAIEAAARAAEARIAQVIERQVQNSEAEARARLAAETENARAVLQKQAEAIGKTLAEQERKATEVLSAKAQRRERVMAREEQSRTARRAQDAIREAERASRDAEERIVQGAESAITRLQVEMEKQRSLIEGQIREDLNRVLGELQWPGGETPQTPS